MASKPNDLPWRLIQTNLPEIAMEDIDAEQYVADLKAMHATVAMINTAGMIASYPTDLWCHTQSPHLHGDSLAAIIAACHREGIRVVARTDFSKVRRPLYEQHPEWACVFPGRGIEDFNGNVHCCINGDYQRVYAPRIIEEVLTKLEVDGIFFNMGGYSTRNYNHEFLGICHCQNCQALFRERFGLALPTHEEMGDPVYRKYLAFKRETSAERQRAIVAVIRQLRPELLIDKATDGGPGFVRSESNTEIGRALPHWQYSGSSNTKVAVTSCPALMASNTTVDFIGYFYRHVAVSPAQQELRLWQALAACGGLDYYLIGRLDNHRDRSGFERVKRVFAFHEQHFSETYQGLRPVASTLLVQGGSGYHGWFRMLTELHVPFNVVSLDALEAADLADYDCLVMANVKHLSDEVATRIDDFVAAGGTLIATGETGFGDDGFEDREGCALRSLGIRTTNAIRRDMRSAVLEVMDKVTFPSMADRDLLCFGDTFVFNEYEETVTSLLRLIPPHPFGPPERCYWTAETDLPGLTVNAYGDGQAVYLPWCPGALFHREGYDNTLVFIGDVLRQLAGRETIGGLSPMVEVSLASRPDGAFKLLQLVNTSGHFGNSFYEPVTMTDLAIELPFKARPRAVERLTDGQPVPFESADGKLQLALDRLAAFEAVKIWT